MIGIEQGHFNFLSHKMVRIVEISEHNPDWAKAFALEAKLLNSLLAHVIRELHHIGSTAVPGLPAKPIIDILVVVENMMAFELGQGALLAEGYHAIDKKSIPGRRYFIKGSIDHRTHHLHVYECGNEHIVRHLIFKDYLLAHPTEAKRYGQLKRRLACAYKKDIDGYQNGKKELIRELTDKAFRWVKGMEA